MFQYRKCEGCNKIVKHYLENVIDWVYKMVNNELVPETRKIKKKWIAEWHPNCIMADIMSVKND